MKKILKISCVILAVVLFSCKAKQSATEEQSTSKDTVVFSKTLTVEFYSKGGGINHEAFSTMKSLLAKPIDGVSCEFENNFKKYGREGERQYCMTFNDEKCYTAMLNLVKQKIGSEKDVRIKENGLCRENK
jgi:hypothetical protein